ncbi:hypothetical protein J7T55_000743 [Diaporthe amygdali]|uniref:uncharacterized protein n=1 Tax=Phomopsis amygdali TaxID=1214568 RepID=UPI0022FDEE59|nr:uncharacterized protein J7T55_000743 [Diaporthe amygdali]KAJ0119893.1 hypothetical protein J7T55_000743 [Diaporthe amygdali]
MPEFTISDDDLAPLSGKVVLLTGCSSGIGLATVKELLKVGAKVVGGDLSDMKSAVDSRDFEFVQVNVTDWKALCNLFKHAISKFGHIDHVFANAGIGPRMNLLSDEFDEDGELKRPNHIVYDVNLAAVVDTVKLGIYYIRKNPSGGSIVVTASASSYQRYPCYDYASAKHGVHGLVRGLFSEIGPETDIPVRLNGIAPGWTNTGLVSESLCAKAGVLSQGPEIPARSALILMAERSRHGEIIHSSQGKYFELESHLLRATDDILQKAPTVEPVTRSLADDYRKILAAFQKEQEG